MDEMRIKERESHGKELEATEGLDKLSTEHAALSAKAKSLEKDNAKLTADNVALVGHANIKQKIQMHAKVKDENNLLKQEKLEAQKLLLHQKKIIERLSRGTGAGANADKENLAAQAIAEEDRLQAALTESEREGRVVRQSVLTLFNLLTPETAPASPAPLSEHKARDWAGQTASAATTLEGILRKGRQQTQDIQASALRIRLLEQQARIHAATETAV
ncbi:hypothetical protein T484DRAFT_2980873 [Baffinella frigidus]|nr:hypothetical protein T484DRAFT_2980873 [Cryptophyta sp. CCMP2293]